ncbi:MAG: polyprenyl synthetase family protein [Anaerolineae bacterium]
MTIEQAMQKVENIMFEVVNSDVKTLCEASRHILEAGGKRIRPRLLLLTYGALGGRDFEYVAPVAAAIELVHTASVVHDDINDHGVVRRGRPSVNAIWGRTFALLTGDFLFTKVYELMAPYKDLNIDLAEATVALVEGETLQAVAVKEKDFTRQAYIQIISRKTAALFRASTSMAAKLAKAQPGIVESLGTFGYNIGLAFQIIDDVLDLTATTEQLGKTSGIDLTQGRGYATAYAGNGQSNGSPHVTDLIIDDPLQMVKQKILADGAVSEARIQAQQLMQLATETINALPDSDYKTMLVEAARDIVYRDR